MSELENQPRDPDQAGQGDDGEDYGAKQSEDEPGDSSDDDDQ